MVSSLKFDKKWYNGSGKELERSKIEFVNKSLFLVVELKQSIPRLFHSPLAQLNLSGRQFEVGNKANTVRISS